MNERFDPFVFDDRALADRLNAMMAYRVGNQADGGEARGGVLALRAVAEPLYPLLHAQGACEETDGGGLVYRLRGRGAAGLLPMMLCAHLGAPGGGERMILAQMEALEALLARGFTPRRDVYLAYTPDAGEGVRACAQDLRARGLRFEFVLGDGGGFADGGALGMPQTLLARVGVFEKGRFDVVLSVVDEGGHASRPKRQTALGVLCRAMGAVARGAWASELNAAHTAMAKALLAQGCDGDFREAAERLVRGDGAAMIRLLQSTPQGRALIETTAVPTMAWAAPAPNVLPQKAEAVFDVRTMRAENKASIVEDFKRAVGDGRVEVTARGEGASATSEAEGEAFMRLGRAVRAAQPAAAVVPWPLAEPTGARGYEGVSPRVYRFDPFSGATAAGLGDGARLYAHLLMNI